MQERRVSIAVIGASREHLALARGLEGPATLLVEPTGVLEDPQGWRDVAARGHWVGNACLVGVSDDGRLPNWTRKTVEQELHMTQEFLQDFFPERECRAFAYPGLHPECADGSYRDVVDSLFDVCLGAELGVNRPPYDVQYLARCEDWNLEALQPGDWAVLCLTPGGKPAPSAEELASAGVRLTPMGDAAGQG